MNFVVPRRNATSVRDLVRWLYETPWRSNRRHRPFLMSVELSPRCETLQSVPWVRTPFSDRERGPCRGTAKADERTGNLVDWDRFSGEPL